MSIVLDGERSKIRLPVGRRLLEQVTSLALIAKSIILDGFFIKAIDLGDDLKKIIIKAPAGAAVLCSTNSGIKLALADYWLGAFGKAVDLWVKDYSSPPADLAWNVSWGEGFKNEVVTRVLFDPAEITFMYPHTPPFAVLEASWMEGQWVSIRGKSEKYVMQRFFNGYAGNGKQAKMQGFGLAVNPTMAPLVLQPFPTGSEKDFAGVLHQKGIYYMNGDNGKLVVAAKYLAAGGGWSAVDYYFLDVFLSMSAGLRDLSLTYTPPPPEGGAGSWNFYAAPAGSYAFQDASGGSVLLHCTSYPYINSSNVVTTHLQGHPEDWPWVLAMSITRGTTSQAYSSAQFLGLLDTMVGGDISALIANEEFADAYALAIETMWQLFPRPNYQYAAKYDSVMFHGAEEVGGTENIYTWTRDFGAFKFTDTGISQVTLALPAEVSAAAVAPVITYAGNGLYLCVCEKLGPTQADASLGVKAVYFGSPFGTWEKIQDAPLVHVRPISVTSSGPTLLGVQKIYNATTAVDEYFFSFFSSGAWRKLGRVAVTPQGITNWSVCLFGETPLVKKMREYPTQPASMPQMPCPTYEGYP